VDAFLEVQQQNLRQYPVPQIHAVDSFDQVLKRERFRADRYHHKFTLVIFSLLGHCASEQDLSVLEEVLQRSVRISDEIGWFDDRRIAVILTDTLDDGANILAKKIEYQMESLNIHVSSSISMYPNNKKYYRTVNTGNHAFPMEMMEKLTDKNKLPLWKKSMDVTVSLITLIILSPLLLTVAILIKYVSPGPIFFRQERVGQGGKIFNFLKFRTMHCNSDESMHRQHAKDFIKCDGDSDKPMAKLDKRDSRIIPFGYFIRQSCIDELPQLINVLRGEMSLVGPRPCIPYEAEEYLQWHARRFDVTPGMTGLWQVSGKNRTTFKEMIRLDIEYSQSRSLFFDLFIIAKTPLVILSQIREVIEKRAGIERKTVESKEIPLRRAVEIA
jgi:lipopolysaccharide/colanic/teichoic acid biosynthesis glycosyltransferase